MLAASAAAQNITITRDTWGIAHVHGHTDAEAVFGMVYAQAEDDFNRIEMNYLTALGRVAEAEGERALAQDLRARLYIDPEDLRARYAQSPAWLQALMTGWADGLNFYLATHPATRPRVLSHFEPWMALAFSEGSIGGDIEDISLPELSDFYGLKKYASLEQKVSEEPTGSNGIAIAPARTRDHHALLLINPHTSFYFRSELQMSSDEGLDAYGAATWGQFFLYQGFNEHLGWMHTSTTADNIDQFRETVVRKDGGTYTKFGNGLKPVAARHLTLAYRAADGSQTRRDFTVYHTVHGPVVAKGADGHWIAESIMFKPVEALEQSYGLTKARDHAAFMQVMQLRANTSNNTVYADGDGTIAYLHPQFIPRRDDRFDYTHPVDGADPHTAWQGPHALSEVPQVTNPATGWVQNTNDSPYFASGSASPAAAGFPRYMDSAGENMRGVHATQLLTDRGGFTLESLVKAAYDADQPGFAKLIPILLADYDRLPQGDTLRTTLSAQIGVLRDWDHRWGAQSVPTSLAVFWGDMLWRAAGERPHGGGLRDYDRVLARCTGAQRLAALVAATDRLTADFGTWRTPWGAINRAQRRTGTIDQAYSDAAPSVAVPFTSGQWGSLASISGPRQAGVKKRYGDEGNSFVAAVEFGPHVRALAVTAGGESGHPASAHFGDQWQRYASGELREVYFYPEDVTRHLERRYRPGE